MNAPDDKAIGIGTAVGMAFVVAAIALTPLLVSGALPIGVLIVVQHAFGIVGKFAAGFTAGYVARRDGAVHGAIVGATTALLGLALGIGLTVARGHGSAYANMPISGWFSIVGWTLVGIGVATVAGLIAERVRR